MNQFDTIIDAELWDKSPWGMVAIDVDGKVSAVNSSFQQYTNISEQALLGMSEADFDYQLIRTNLIAQHRVKMTTGTLRAVHYLRYVNNMQDELKTAEKMSNIAELLREPLASIYGFAELLLTQHYDEQTRLDLTAILLQQTEVMSDLINKNLEARKD